MFLINVKNIPKDILLYNLWLHAGKSKLMRHYDEKFELNLSIIRKDISTMIKNNRKLFLTTYYGRSLFIDITNDEIDISDYNYYNVKPAEEIITELKEEEMRKLILQWYKY